MSLLRASQALAVLSALDLRDERSEESMFMTTPPMEPFSGRARPAKRPGARKCQNCPATISGNKILCLDCHKKTLQEKEKPRADSDVPDGLAG